jgi:hypothetical protein
MDNNPYCGGLHVYADDQHATTLYPPYGQSGKTLLEQCSAITRLLHAKCSDVLLSPFPRGCVHPDDGAPHAKKRMREYYAVSFDECGNIQCVFSHRDNAVP